MPSLKFNLTKNFVTLFEVLLFCWHYFESAFIFLLTLVYILIFLQCHGDIEPNPGPKKKKKLATFQFAIGILIAYLHIVLQN